MSIEYIKQSDTQAKRIKSFPDEEVILSLKDLKARKAVLDASIVEIQAKADLEINKIKDKWLDALNTEILELERIGIVEESSLGIVAENIQPIK